MRESEETYYGSDMDSREERFIQMQSERGSAAEQRMSRGSSIHPCINRALNGRHILLIGSTGSGKTYAAAYMSQFMDAYVFINTQEEESVSRACQVQLDDPSDLQDALEEGYRGIEYVPSMDRDEAIEEVEEIRAQLFEIGSEMKAQAQVLELPFWISVFLDEAQIYSPLMSHKDAENFFTRGRGYGIKSIAITRQPQELSKEIVNNVEYELIFRLGDYAFPYFTRFKIPIEEHQDWTDQEHHFLLYDKRMITRCEPIK